MNVQAINGISSTPKYEMKKVANNFSAQGYPQMDAPISKDAAKALESASLVNFEGRRHHKKSNSLRNAAMATAIGAMTLGGVSSCDKALVESESWSAACTKSDAKAWAPCNPDPIVDHDTITVHDTINNVVRDTIVETVIEPVVVRTFPPALNDSLIHQGLNIGAELDGPAPAKNVMMVGARYYNEYDYKLYEAKLDSVNTNEDQISYITKVTDMYDPDEPKTYYLSTRISDVPGVGIKFTRYILPEKDIKASDLNKYPKANDYRFQYLESEVRTNGNVITRDADGEVTSRQYSGRNIGRIYDRQNGLPDGRLVDYLKGVNPGEFLFGQYVYDDNGNPYLDENGNHEKAVYDFTNAKMWSREVKIVDPNTYYWGK